MFAAISFSCACFGRGILSVADVVVRLFFFLSCVDLGLVALAPGGARGFKAFTADLLPLLNKL